MGFELAFIVSMLVLALTIWYTAKNPSKWLHAFTIGTYIMLFVMMLPFATMNRFWDALRSILLSFVKSAQVFTLGAEFEAEVELFNTSQTFAWIYIDVLALLYLAAPVLVARFLLTYSRTTRNLFKWKFNRRKEVWIFSEPSEKALLFAQSVLEDEREDICVVFCDVDDDHYERVAEIGAIAAMRKIDELDGGYFNRRRCPTTLLFMAEDEERNLEQTLNFVEKRKSAIEESILLYCFTSKPEAG